VPNWWATRPSAQTGRDSVTQKFAPDTMVDTIEKVYQELIRAD